MPRTRLIAAAAATLLALPAVPADAGDRPLPGAGGFDTISSTGTCDAESTWTLSARSRGLRIQLILELATGQPGERWRARLSQNGETIARGGRKSRADGSVRLRRPAANLPGVDEFAVVARNKTTGEKCRGTLSY